MKAIRVLLFLLFIFIVVIGIFYTKRSIIYRWVKSYNILLISIDTLRADHMGVYGYSKKTTPNIDLWAKSAYVFVNAHTIIPFTYPSLASLMTGQHFLTSRITRNAVSPPLSENSETFAEKLNSIGYKTAGFITNRFIGNKLSNLDQGFDEFQEFDGFGSWKKNREIYYKFLQNSVEWLEKNRKNKFFMWVHLMDPHDIYYPEKKTLCELYPSRCETYLRMQEEEVGQIMTSYFSCRKDEIPREKVEFLKSLYDADIVMADRWIGTFLQKLMDLNLDKKTIVILFGDHGESFDHNYLAHGKFLYDSTTKIPLIIKIPNVTLNQKKINTLIDNTDILKTISRILGIKDVNLTDDGFSFEDKFLDGITGKINNSPQRKYIISANFEQTKFSIRDQRYKYIFTTDNGCTYLNQKDELYDMESDPAENTNIFKSRSIVGEKLKTKLMEHLSQYNLPLSSPEGKMVDPGVMERLKSLGY